MKYFIAILFCPFLFLTSCKVSHYNVNKIQSKYEKKMSRKKTDKYKSFSNGQKFEMKRADLKNKVDIYFSESEIKKPFKVIEIAAWNPVNFRVLVPFLPFFTKSHIYNQTLRRAALITASAGGDGAIITNGPIQYQIIKYY